MKSVGGDDVGLAPGDQPLGHRPGTRQRLGQPGVGGGDLVFEHRGGAHAVTGLHLLDVADGFSRQTSGRGEEPHDLGPQPPAPGGGDEIAGGVGCLVEGSTGVERGQQGACLGHQLGRRGWGGRGGARRRGGRAVVGVDQAVDVATERQSEVDVAPDDSGRWIGAGAHPRWVWRKSIIRCQARADAAES